MSANQLSYLAVPTFTERVLHEAAQAEPVAVRLNRHGPGALSLVELLQVLLGTDDALLPMQLLSKWPTLAELAHASPRELTRWPGMTPVRLARLRAALELAQRKQKPAERARATSPVDIANWLMPHMAGLTQEQFWVVLIDTKMRIVSGHMLYQGNVNSTIIRPAEVFAEAVRAVVPNIAIAHNHPSGEASDPSPEDVCVTRAIIKAGKVLDIQLVDHLVIGNGRFTSLKERGLAFSA